jgi:hypothetical protein
MIPAHLAYFLAPALFVLQGCGGNGGGQADEYEEEAWAPRRKTGGVCQTACNEFFAIFDNNPLLGRGAGATYEKVCPHFVKAQESGCTEEVWDSEKPELECIRRIEPGNETAVTQMAAMGGHTEPAPECCANQGCEFCELYIFKEHRHVIGNWVYEDACKYYPPPERKAGGVCQTACNEYLAIFDLGNPGLDLYSGSFAWDSLCPQFVDMMKSGCTQELWESEKPVCRTTIYSYNKTDSKGYVTLTEYDEVFNQERNETCKGYWT